VRAKDSVRRPDCKPVQRRSASLKLELAICNLKLRIPVAQVRRLRRHLRTAHRLVSSPLQELSIALVGDAQMSKLHRQFMNLAGPTDVLTFPLEQNARGQATAGEIIICVPEARRQARWRRSRVEEELLLYALHGMLHLNGMDDRTPAGFRKMHQSEDEILTRLGVGAVFSSPRRRLPERTRRNF